MPALAITDHGNMFGAIEFYDACMKSGVKPIIGCETYIAPGSRFDKTYRLGQETSFHLTLLAKDETGYKNLMKLVSLGHLEGFYYKPRIDKEVLAKYSQGLVGLSGCLKGEVPRFILADKIDDAINVTSSLKDIFSPGDFYLEMQDNSLQEQKKVNKCLLEISKKLSLPLIATNDVHYLAKDNARAHEALLCIQTQTTLDDPNRMRLQTDEFYFKSPQEMKKLFSEFPGAVENTIEVAQKCNLELDFSAVHLPHFKPPDGMSRTKYLHWLVMDGMRTRYKEITEDIKNRVEQELKIINDSGYTSYFLIAWDFVHYAKQKGISVGPGRGSAAGSVVSYALGITDIDPLKYNLIFERFLNPERVSLPDIDIDFCYERRGEVIDYVTQKYSKENVAQIITFGTMQARAVIRDVGRAMAMPYSDVDRIAKLVPGDIGMTLELALQQEPELAKLYKSDSQIAQLIDTSKVLEGLSRHASTHAAGVVISEKPLTEHIPLYKPSEEQITTGYPMNSLEKIGLLKMDFLGLRTLTVIAETVKLIKRVKGEDISIDKISLDDKKTFKLLAKAETLGIFQLESSGMRDLLKKLDPTKFEDIVALLALFRPGPIGSGMLDDFIRRKHGHVKIVYDHPLLEPILKNTYGVVVFQEQVMQIASQVAGFSMSQADLLRRAMAKKTPEIMEQLRVDFIKGALEKGVDKRISEKIFNFIEYFSGYGFNLSHSAAYAMISYRTAFLKANYPVEFMTALLTSEKDNTDKVVAYHEEANRMGINVFPPDVNESFAKFTVVEDPSSKVEGKKAIRFGLLAVKNVGLGAIESIVASREKTKKFNSLYEFCEHIDLRLANRKVIESLIKCGALDSLGLYRSQLMASLDKSLEAASTLQKDRMRGQLSFFDASGESSSFRKKFEQAPNIKEWPESQLLGFEKEMLGFYVTGHPLAKYEKYLKTYASTTTSGLKALKDGQTVSIAGIVARLKNTVTKRTNERMAIAGIEDLDGIAEVLVFPSTYQSWGRFLRKDAIVFVKGKLSLREEEPKILADEIMPLEHAREKYTAGIVIKLVTTGLEEDKLESLKQILESHKGGVPVYLEFVTSEGQSIRVQAEKQFFIQPKDSLITKIEDQLGDGVVRFITK